MDSAIFRYKFKPKKTFSYTVDITGFMNVKTPMGTLENPIEIYLEINQKIVSVENKVGIIDMVINKAKAGKKMASVPLQNNYMKLAILLDKKNVFVFGRDAL